MDVFDRRLLNELQRDSSRSLAELAGEIGLSASACHRRIKTLEEMGLIVGYGARLDRAALGLELEAFVAISLAAQSQEALQGFEAAVAASPDIRECYLTAGSADYMLRIAARNMADYDRIHRDTLSRLPGVSSMQSTFAIRDVKPWQGYPVG
ncbi:MAG: Lrp/AsnC family transcriptional regulator [Magnetovibrionaceae bacterium]